MLCMSIMPFHACCSVVMFDIEGNKFWNASKSKFPGVAAVDDVVL